MRTTTRLQRLTRIIEGAETSLTFTGRGDHKWAAAMKVNRHGAQMVTRYGRTPREAIDGLHRAILAVRFVPSDDDQPDGPQR